MWHSHRGTLGPQWIHHPDVLSADFAEQPAVLPCYGWQCEHHPYEVVMPLRAADNRSPDDGWTGVRVKLADGRVCQIAVPEREVSERVE